MNLALDLLLGFVKAGLLIGIVLQIVPLLIYLERKISAYMQARVGPNRVNLYLFGRKLIPGSLQPLADAIKLATKEEIVPAKADKLLWYLGPIAAFLPIGTALAFIPFGTPNLEVGGHVINLQVASAETGVLALFAVASLGVYGIAMGGWGSGSKYPLMAAVRSSAQMISYEIAMGLALLAAIVTAGSVDLQEFVLIQATGTLIDWDAPAAWMRFEGLDWLLFKQPLAAMIFMIAMFAENNRLPFDMPECEPELVGGFHTEYSGLKFALFFLGEYAAMFLMCSLFTTLFLGGWSLPGVVDPHSTTVLNAVLSHVVFITKVMVLLTFQIWIRWTLPRFRYDQLMSLGWKVLVPLALLNLIVTAIVLAL